MAMTMEERAPKTDAILHALGSGSKVRYILEEETKATHDDLSFVKEQEFVDIDNSKIATIMYSLRPKGRDVLEANGLLNYLENLRLDKQKLLDKSELEKQVATLQKDKLEYDQTIRDKDAEIKRLQTQHLTNQKEIYPTEKATKQLTLFKDSYIDYGCYFAIYFSSSGETRCTISMRTTPDINDTMIILVNEYCPTYSNRVMFLFLSDNPSFFGQTEERTANKYDHHFFITFIFLLLGYATQGL